MPKPAWVVKKCYGARRNWYNKQLAGVVALKIDTFTVFLSEAANKPICRGAKELLPIDEKEFLTVSKLVRGRAKLHDVNKVHV